MQKISEVFNKFRKERCFKLFYEIHQRWLSACDPRDLKIICDTDLDGKHLEELGDVYFEIGFDGNFTKLPLIDTIACFTLLERAIQGRPLIRWYWILGINCS